MQQRTSSEAITLFGKKIPIHDKFEKSADCCGSPKTPLMEEERSRSSDSQPEKELSDLTNRNERPKLKRPDKIIPCPRCKSMNTKFCYYNNYNPNQPRHFCKACQRYWTAGGSMRNVPVGAGRRKNKSSASYYRYITISEALQHSGPNSQLMKTNAKVLNFEAPICDSMDLKLALDETSTEEGRRQESCVRSPPVSYQVVPCPYAWSPVFQSGYQMPLYQAYWFKDEEAKPVAQTSNVLVPKTLRFDDPEEASKSSLWRMREGFFKALQPKSDGKSPPAGAFPALQVNPAAISRSKDFHELS